MGDLFKNQRQKIPHQTLTWLNDISENYEPTSKFNDLMDKTE